MLFVLSFPVYGIGAYLSGAKSPSLGYLVSAAPHLCITFFYVLDLIYQGEFRIKVNALYGWMTLFLISSAASLFVALYKDLPETNQGLTVIRSVLLLVPFQSFIAVRLYNADGASLAKLTFISFSVLLVINLVGFLFGIKNEIHNIEGRVNFPFLDGIYSGSCLIAVICLMLLNYFADVRTNIFKLTGWIAYLSFNLLLLFLINSRLTILVLLVVCAIMLFNMIEKINPIFWISMFTVPILLSTGLLIYRILTMPVFVSVLQRVDIVDITTFHGRAFLWNDALDWLLYDRQGLLFGHGYKGHYFLYLVSDVAKMWNEKNLHHLHLHSTSLEILVSQGLVFYIIFMFVFYRVIQYYKKAHHQKTTEGMFLAVSVFLLFILQVDTFLYMESVGGVIFAWLASAAALRSTAPVEQRAVDFRNRLR